MPAPVVPQCGHCEARAPTPLPTTCSKCSVAVYCSAEHMKAHATTHAKTCKKVDAARKNFVKEEKKLRRLRFDCFEPGEVFDECIGEFYLVYETRPFMRAKYMLVDALIEAGTARAIEEALKEASECVTLDEQDHQGVREIVPALMLLLGKVQEAYDFLYWWAGNHDNDVSDNDDHDEDEEEEYDEEEDDMEDDKPSRIVPCLRPTKMNPTDPIDFFRKPYVNSIFHRSALTYVKLTTAFGLNGAVQQLASPSLDETAHAPLRAFLQANNLPTTVEALKALYETVLQQAQQAFDLAHSDNPHLWPTLLDPVAALRSPPSIYSPGTASEVRQHLEVYAKLWHATPYAIDYVATQIQA